MEDVPFECEECGSSYIHADGVAPTECPSCADVSAAAADVAADGECYVCSDSGPLGARISVAYMGKFWREFAGDTPWSDAQSAILENMDREKYWPDVVYVDDHGGAEFVEVSA